MSSRKRSSRAVEGDPGDAEPSLLHRIRNMWQFANLCQWIYIFGKAAKIPESIDIEEIETECLKPNSPMLGDMALSILELASSHRGLTLEIFDDQSRKLFQSRAPDSNPFGSDETPAKFDDFDVLTKIRVMQKLTQWVMVHPERIREKMDEQKDIEQTNWRIEPYGWDAEDRTYFVLDDNRVYRMTEPPTPVSTPKPKRSKSWRGGRRSSKRRRTTISNEDQTDTENGGEEERPVDDGFGGFTWECLAVTLDDVRAIVNGFRKTRDDNEKILKAQLEDHLLPILEKQEDNRKRKEIQRERELLNLSKMANAKRSSRIANKMEQQKQEEQAREEERNRREAEVAKRRQEQADLKREVERDNRLISREQRLRERESRRLQHEEELAQLSEDSRNAPTNHGRVSERHLQAEIEKNKQALKNLEQEEDEWVFDCTCGLYGQVDDGTHSVACERCNIWQHSKCLGITEAEAERPDFQFVCSSCTHREQEAKSRPKTTIKLKVAHPPKDTERQDRPILQTPNKNPSTTDEPPLKHATLTADVQHTAPNGVTGRASSPLSSSQINDSLKNGVESSAHPKPGTPVSILNHTNIGLSPGSIPIIPAPVKLEAGDAERGLQVNGLPHSAVAASPTMSARTASPSSSFQSLPGGRSFEATLSTPKISRDIYRAAHMQNGSLPAEGGLSPTKHSPPRLTDPSSAGKINITTPILPPVANLSPSPRPQVLTPPSKSSEPLRPVNSPTPRP